MGGLIAADPVDHRLQAIADRTFPPVEASGQVSASVRVRAGELYQPALWLALVAAVLSAGAGEDWGAAIAYAVAAFHRSRVRQLVFQETLLPGLAAGPGLPGGGHDPSLAADDMRTGWHFSFFSLPNLPELLLAGRERPFWTWYARRHMWDPSALAEEDIDEMVHSAEQPGGTRAMLEMYRARQTDAEQNRPHYADPISCPVLAVGAQAYLGDAVSRQLTQVARDVRGVVIPAAGHNIALENPAALAQAYLDFFAGR